MASLSFNTGRRDDRFTLGGIGVQILQEIYKNLLLAAVVILHFNVADSVSHLPACELSLLIWLSLFSPFGEKKRVEVKLLWVLPQFREDFKGFEKYAP